jgi:hypothetical protein
MADKNETNFDFERNIYEERLFLLIYSCLRSRLVKNFNEFIHTIKIPYPHKTFPT